jgi:hypothetical protein
LRERGSVLLGDGGAPAGHVSNPELLQGQLRAPRGALWEACREARPSSEVWAGREAAAAIVPVSGAQLRWEIGGQLVVRSLGRWLLFCSFISMRGLLNPGAHTVQPNTRAVPRGAAGGAAQLLVYPRAAAGG